MRTDLKTKTSREGQREGADLRQRSITTTNCKIIEMRRTGADAAGPMIPFVSRQSGAVAVKGMSEGPVKAKSGRQTRVLRLPSKSCPCISREATFLRRKQTMSLFRHARRAITPWSRVMTSGRA